MSTLAIYTSINLAAEIPRDLNSPPFLCIFLIVISYINILVYRTREVFVNTVKISPPLRILYVKKRELVIAKKFNFNYITIL